MNENDVIKALECCCKAENCRECLFWEMHSAECIKALLCNALAIIKRQQAEIESLKEIANPKCQQCVEQTRKNSFIEFADLFKQQMRDCACAEFDGIKYYLIGEEFVNRRLKEMTEGK